jgi:hypothetical protein
MMGGLFHYYTELMYMVLYGFMLTVYTVSITLTHTINYGIRYDVSGFNNGYILEVKAEGCRMMNSIPFSTE